MTDGKIYRVCIQVSDTSYSIAKSNHKATVEENRVLLTDCRRCHSYLTNVRDLASYWQKEQVDLLDRAIEQLDQFMALLEAGKG